ncbi:MAG: class I SAM-dependent methyltransferase [bacterium]|nr:class I SAM-dependent methyltransferase [bacterium]
MTFSDKITKIRQLITTGKTEEATVNLEALLKLYPDIKELYPMICKLYINVKKFDIPTEWVKKAIEVERGLENILKNFGYNECGNMGFSKRIIIVQQLIEKNNIEEAITRLKALCVKYPERKELYIILYELYVRTSNIEKAIDCLKTNKTPYCNVCGSPKGFLDSDLALKELINTVCCEYNNKAKLLEYRRQGLNCLNCSSNSRDRMLVYQLAECLGKEDEPMVFWTPNKKLKILEISGGRPRCKILEQKFDYLDTEYIPEKVEENINSCKYVDVQNLPFSSNSFDIVIAADVFEHVRLDDKGYCEIFRVLKRFGKFFLSLPIPIESPAKTTIIRVKPEGEKDVYLLPSVYHGGHTLVYRDYGMDLLEKLKKFGFTVDYKKSEIKEHKISKQHFIVCSKNL